MSWGGAVLESFCLLRLVSLLAVPAVVAGFVVWLVRR